LNGASANSLQILAHRFPPIVVASAAKLNFLVATLRPCDDLRKRDYGAERALDDPDTTKSGNFPRSQVQLGSKDRDKQFSIPTLPQFR
jgi:hypothetical protein